MEEPANEVTRLLVGEPGEKLKKQGIPREEEENCCTSLLLCRCCAEACINCETVMSHRCVQSWDEFQELLCGKLCLSVMGCLVVVVLFLLLHAVQKPGVVPSADEHAFFIKSDRWRSILDGEVYGEDYIVNMTDGEPLYQVEFDPVETSSWNGYQSVYSFQDMEKHEMAKITGRTEREPRLCSIERDGPLWAIVTSASGNSVFTEDRGDLWMNTTGTNYYWAIVEDPIRRDFSLWKNPDGVQVATNSKQYLVVRNGEDDMAILLFSWAIHEMLNHCDDLDSPECHF